MQDPPSGCSQTFLHPPNLRKKHHFFGKMQIFFCFSSFFLRAENPWWGLCVFLWCQHLQIQVSTLLCSIQATTSPPKGSGNDPKIFGSSWQGQSCSIRDPHEMALEPQPWSREKIHSRDLVPKNFLFSNT